MNPSRAPVAAAAAAAHLYCRFCAVIAAWSSPVRSSTADCSWAASVSKSKHSSCVRPSLQWRQQQWRQQQHCQPPAQTDALVTCLPLSMFRAMCCILVIWQFKEAISPLKNNIHCMCRLHLTVTNSPCMTNKQTFIFEPSSGQRAVRIELREHKLLP